MESSNTRTFFPNLEMYGVVSSKLLFLLESEHAVAIHNIRIEAMECRKKLEKDIDGMRMANKFRIEFTI